MLTRIRQSPLGQGRIASLTPVHLPDALTCLKNVKSIPHFNSMRPLGLLLISLSFCFSFGAIDAFAVPQSIAISSPADLASISSNPTADYHLTQDIDLAAVTNYQPIGTNAQPFSGTFDGNNYTIRNLTIGACPQGQVDFNDPFHDEDFIGLFAFTDNATIRNVILRDVSVFGESMVGSLVGQCRQSTVTNCKAIGGTVGGQRQVGGLIGFIGDSDVTNCLTDLDVDYCGTGFEADFGFGILTITHPTNWFGGVVGHAHPYRFPGKAPSNTGDGCFLSSCIAFGDVYGGFMAGGVVGNFHGSTMYSSYALGNVETEYSAAGGLIGYIQVEQGLDVPSPTPIQTIVFACTCTGDVTANAYGMPPLMQGGFPVLTTIGSGNAATAGGFVGYCEGGVTNSSPSALALTVISFSRALGDVTFDEPTSGVNTATGGFVGRTEVDTLIRSCDATGDVNSVLGSGTGGFIGWSEGTIKDSKSEGNVIAGQRSGGFAGQIASTPGGNVAAPAGPFSGQFIRCASFGSVVSNHQGNNILGIAIGGFVGYSFGGVEFDGCESHGATTAALAENDGFVGGFIGQAANDTFTACFSTGDVFTKFGDSGGFIGHQRLRVGFAVDNCFSTGDVVYTGSGTPAPIGGFIGRAQDFSATITNCYSAGNISATGPEVKGFVGRVNGTDFAGCYWDTTTAGQTGSQPAGVNGRTTAQMQQQATFVGWDFNNIWSIIGGVDYPFFQ